MVPGVTDIECLALLAINLYQTSSSTLPEQFEEITAKAFIVVPVAFKLQVRFGLTFTTWAFSQRSLAGGGGKFLTQSSNVPLFCGKLLQVCTKIKYSSPIEKLVLKSLFCCSSKKTRLLPCL